VKRRGASHLFLPGGHVEPGESIPASLRREITEEFGIACTPGPFLGVVEHAFGRGEAYTREINFLFLVDAAPFPRGGPPPSREAHIESVWVACEEEELRARNLQPWILCGYIPAYAGGEPWPSYLSTLGRTPGDRFDRHEE